MNFIVKVINIITNMGIIGYMVYIYQKLKKSENRVNDTRAANTVSTLGVLGTFIGISIGLWFFDANDISNSVPNLLSGMKTAFITSIIGMIGSLCIKYKQGKWKSEEQEEDIDDIVDLFNRMIKESRTTNETLIKNQAGSKEMFIKLGEVLVSNQSD